MVNVSNDNNIDAKSDNQSDVERKSEKDTPVSTEKCAGPDRVCESCGDHVAELGKNRVREVSKNIHDWIMSWGISSYAIGMYYQICHYILIVCGTFVIAFNTNPWELLIMLVIISLDALANVVVHDCPLTLLEEKYLQDSIAHERRENLRNAQICYTCTHVYESQIDLIVNMWTIVACKILVILAKRTITPAFLAM